MTRPTTAVWAVLLLAVLAVLAIAPAVAMGAKPSFGCGAGFDIGATTFEQYLQLPRTQAALTDGVIDEATLLAALAKIDQNDDEIVCVQRPPGWDVSARPFAQYLYNVVDNAASAP